jgi:hypothetical protein
MNDATRHLENSASCKVLREIWRPYDLKIPPHFGENDSPAGTNKIKMK